MYFLLHNSAKEFNRHESKQTEPNALKKILFISLFSCFYSFGFGQWNTDRILTIGKNALYFEDYVLSIQYFNQVIKIKPYLAEPYMYRSMAKIQLGDLNGAELDANEALERNPFMPQAYYIRGFARRQLGLYTDAAHDFSKALEFSPNSLNLLMNRMDALMKEKDYEAAMQDLEMYMSQNPKNSALYYEKAIIQLSMKDSIGAETSLNELLSRDSTSSMGWSVSGLLKMQKNELEAAYSDYSKAIQYKTNYYGDYINRGIINVKRNNFREALSDYNKAIELEPESDLAYFNRALLRVNLGDNNNALDDFNKILELDSTNNEAVFQRAMLLSTLGDHKAAIADFQTIIDRYPYFIPAFWGIAEAETARGNQRNAFKYRQLAYEIEQNKDKIQKDKQEEIATDNKIADNTQKSAGSRKTELFNRYITQNVDDSNTESKYEDELRGNIQNRNVDVMNEKNFILTYYAKQDEIRRTNLYHPLVDDYNSEKNLMANLKLTNNDIALTSELVNTHFEIINNISHQLTTESTNADLFFYRAIEFALVQDFNSAVEDLNNALSLRPSFTLAYFYRANIRYKLIEYLRNTANEQSASLNEQRTDQKNKALRENQFKIDVELMMRDYDKVMELQPDFRFAYYNKANILCTQQDFKSAITNYNKAIDVDPDFAEAYFNRGLTYLFIGENEKGLADLSKAGELGIYQSYNLIKKFEK